MAEDVAKMPAVEMRQKIGAKDLSPVEVAEACLEQIDKHNETINAICTLSQTIMDEARDAEARVMRGDDLGPLHGIPVGIKDVTPTRGLRTTYGSKLYADHVPLEDALVVRRFKKAGAIIMGKTNTPEFATGGNTFNEVFGRTRNPWNPELSAGGSTGGGAAALATGMIACAEGTDLGGSLRIPASFCGVVGLRPSPGLVPTVPSEYLWDTMQVSGGIARTIPDVALMLQAVAGPSTESPIAQPMAGRDFVAATGDRSLSGLRIAYCPDIAAIGIDSEIEQVCRQAALNLRSHGAIVEEIELDLSYAWQPFLAIRGFWMVAQQFRRLDRRDEFGDNLRGNIEAGLQTSMEDLGAAEAARTKVWLQFQDFFEGFDHLVTPCMAVPPFSVEQNYPEHIAGKKMATYIDWIAPTFLLSLSGLPIACVPCGLSPGDLPVGVQILGPPFGEEKVLSLANQIQKDHPIGLPQL